MDIPVAHSSDAVIRFFDVIKDDAPWVVNNDYLISKGFKSGNHTELRGVFRGLHFLDEANMPTKRWHDYKDDPYTILQIALKEGYDELFSAYPDADRQDKSVLTSWLREHKEYSPITAIRAVRIFKRLCEFAQMTDSTQVQVAPTNISIQQKEQQRSRRHDVIDEFFKEKLQDAVNENIITTRQSEDFWAMYLGEGQWKSKQD
jgi:hypothetical protein